jgi:hypothetical protein
LSAIGNKKYKVIFLNLDVKHCELISSTRWKPQGTAALDGLWLGMSRSSAALGLVAARRRWKASARVKRGAREGEAGCADLEYYDPVQAKMADDSKGACPLSCPEMEAAYEGVIKKWK